MAEFPQCAWPRVRDALSRLHHVRRSYLLYGPVLVDEIADGVSKMRLDLTMNLLDFEEWPPRKMSVKPLVQAFIPSEEHQSQRAFRTDVR